MLARWHPFEVKFGVRLLDGFKDRWICRLRHSLRLVIRPSETLRIFAARFFEQLNDVRGLLLAYDRKLQSQLFAELSKFVFASLRGQNQNDDVKRYKRDRRPKSREWRGIDRSKPKHRT